MKQYEAVFKALGLEDGTKIRFNDAKYYDGESHIVDYEKGLVSPWQEFNILSHWIENLIEGDYTLYTPKPKTIYDLKEGDCYYSIDVENLNKRIAIGNAFLTEEEAKLELQKREVEAIMKKYAKPFAYGEYNHCLTSGEDDIYVEQRIYTKTQGTYFFEKEIAKKVIKEIGEERLKAYFKGELYVEN